MWFRLYERVLTRAWVWQLKVCVYLSWYMLNYQLAFYRYFRNISPVTKRKEWKIEYPGFFFWNQLNYCSQNSWRARDSWRADEDEVGGLDRIAVSPSFPYLLYTIFSSLNDSPLPDIFSTMFFLRYRGWWRLSFLNMKAKFTTSIFLHRNN